MTAFFDTNILIPLSKADDNNHQWCMEKLQECQDIGPVVISDIVYCEFSVGMDSKEHADEVIGQFGIERLPTTDEALFRASVAYKLYRQRGGPKRVLPDFLIGAAAETAGIPLVTANPGDFANYFPALQLVTP